MSNFFEYSHELAIAVGIVLTVFSQILLRIGAQKSKVKLIMAINSYTIVGYSLFLIVVLLMIFALQTIQLKTLMVWESLTYILTPIFAFIILKESVNLRLFGGSLLIVVGIIVYCL